MFDRAGDPPPLIVVDTSAVACSLLQDQPGHEEYTDFLARAVRDRSTIAYGELLDLELAQTCVKLARARIDAARGSAEDRKLEAITLGQRLRTDVFSRWRELISLTDSVRIPIGAAERAGEFGSPVRRDPCRDRDEARRLTPLR